jgi:hypothetical protein
MSEKTVQVTEMTPEAAPGIVMSEQESSTLEREIILNATNPDYVLPDGRKNSDIWREREARDETDQNDAREFWERSIKANTSRVETVSLRMTPDGLPILTVESVRPAATQDVAEATVTLADSPTEAGAGQVAPVVAEMPPQEEAETPAVVSEAAPRVRRQARVNEREGQE